MATSASRRRPAKANAKTGAKANAKTGAKPNAKTGAEVPPPSPAPEPSNGLAVASIAFGVGGFTFLPLVGGLVASLLGALSLRKQRQDPQRYSGHGLALAGSVLGWSTGILPALIVTMFASRDATPLPFMLVAAFAGFVFVTAFHGRPLSQKLAFLGGSVAVSALAILVAIGLAFLTYYALEWLFVQIASGVADFFRDLFDEMGRSFGSCNNFD